PHCREDCRFRRDAGKGGVEGLPLDAARGGITPERIEERLEGPRSFTVRACTRNGKRKHQETSPPHHVRSGADGTVCCRNEANCEPRSGRSSNRRTLPRE